DISVTRHANSQYFPVNSNTFSEGEKQALVILGINELVLKENSLALFDEPDTYLHPQRQRDFIFELESHISNLVNIENNYIITLDSSYIGDGNKKEKLYVFKNRQSN